MRSFLFVPGDSERKLAKAGASAADALIIDLEDAVAGGRKSTARSQALDYLRSRTEGEGPQCFVRVNSRQSMLLLEDLTEVMKGRPAGIVLPKCESQADLDLLGHYISALEVREKIAPDTTRIIAIATETARSVINLASTPLFHQRLIGLLWGGEDLSADLGAEANRDEGGGYLEIFKQVRHTCLLAAAAADVMAIDAVYTRVSDPRGLADEVQSARALGFNAKAAIHPDQIGIIHEGLSPSAQQVEWAKRVLKIFQSDQQEGVLKLDGQMLDRPHLKQAKHILKRAQGSAVADPVNQKKTHIG